VTKLKRTTILLLATLWTALGCAGGRQMWRRPAILFDDFNYAKPEEVAGHGWIIRTELGWPGLPGAAWGKESFSFIDDPEQPGNRLLRMTASTDGTAERTRQAQLCHQRKYLEGTYGARVRFTDVPLAGPNGDQVVETFYAVSPLKAPMDPDYGETDFEYLPNGGWGHTGPTIFFTTWKTFSPEPNWKADNVSTNKAGPMAGWHTLVSQVSGGTVRYYVDGSLVANHGGGYFPASIMSINFNLWFVRNGFINSSDVRQYQEDVDWVFFEAGTARTPAEVEAEVARMRRKGVRFQDTVPESGLKSPCNL
jgi:hypothetical protein